MVRFPVTRHALLLVLALAVPLGGAPAAGEQDTAQGGGQDAAAMPPEMAAWMELGAPVEHHAHLAKLEGTWKTEARFWMAPGTEPMVSEGKQKNTLILGGRYLRTDYKGEFMGNPFHGVGFEGFDKQQGEHFSIWMDDMSTHVMVMRGDCAEGGKIVTVTTDYVDPMSGETKKMKGVTTVFDDNKYTYESWDIAPDGNSFKNMEVVYTR